MAWNPRRIRWITIVAAGVLLFLTHARWLNAIGAMLMENDRPRRSDAVLVLAGDHYGDRVLRGAQLVREGYAPVVLVSGPECCYGIHESDLAIPFAVRHGYPADWFVPVPMKALSTREEAQAVLPEMKRRDIRAFLLVTSDYHTRRAARVYRSVTPADSFRVIASVGHSNLAKGWWRDQEGQKEIFLEWTKTIVYWFGVR